ncbi:MAG: 3-keto-5-aminohexanoate cleavage protein [Sedimentibacter sp.]
MFENKDYYVGNMRNVENYTEKISKRGLSQFPPLIISCAITGGAHGKETNPNLPVTIEEQVQSAYEAYNAGASLIHIHTRDPKNNYRTMDPNWESYAEVNARIREKCPDVIINNTYIGGRVIDNELNVSEPMCTSAPALPEVASLDLGTWSTLMKMPLKQEDGTVKNVTISNTYLLNHPEAEKHARILFEKGIKTECEMYSINDFKYINFLISLGLIESPYWIQLLLGGNGVQPNIDFMQLAANMLPAESLLSIIGVGPCQTPIITAAMILGHHVRVGLEDSVYFDAGELAKSNAQLVERAVNIAKEIGRPVATPAQAREMMGLNSPREYKWPL